MTRTFSLRRLLFGMTALCVVAGLAVNFPLHALVAAAVIGWLAPTLLVVQIGLLFSKRRWATIVWGLLGALAGTCLTPAVMAPARPSWWDQYVSCYLLFAIPPACGALCVVIGAVLDDRFRQSADSSAAKREP